MNKDLAEMSLQTRQHVLEKPAATPEPQQSSNCKRDYMYFRIALLYLHQQNLQQL
jgi:hypothetical protein